MAYICSCKGINDDAVSRAIRDGASTVEAVIEHCEAGADCGGCHPSIETLITIEADLATSRDRTSAA